MLHGSTRPLRTVPPPSYLLQPRSPSWSISTAHPDDLYAMLTNLTWYIGGAHVTEPTASDLANVRKGDIACLVPPMGDKTDAYGVAFGNDCMYFRYDPDDALGCAFWLHRRECIAPAPGKRAIPHAPARSALKRANPARRRHAEPRALFVVGSH